MNLASFVLYAGLGRLIIWLLQISGLMQPIWELHELATELRDCDLCLGFWVYLALALAQPGKPFGQWPKLVEVVLLAALTTFVVHLIKIGWQDKFGTVVVT